MSVMYAIQLWKTIGHHCAVCTEAKPETIVQCDMFNVIIINNMAVYFQLAVINVGFEEEHEGVMSFLYCEKA